MTNPLNNDFPDAKNTKSKDSQQSNTDNYSDNDDEQHDDQSDLTISVTADRGKLLQSSLERTSQNGGNASTNKPEKKLSNEFPKIGLADSHKSHIASLSLDQRTVKSPLISQHEEVELDYENMQVTSMSLNQAKTTLQKLRLDIIARGYNPRERVLGRGTEPSNTNNPFVNLDDLYNPNDKSIDLLKLHKAKQSIWDFQKIPNKDLTNLNPLLAREQITQADPFAKGGMPELSESQLQQKEKEAAIGFILANASPEERRQYAQRQAIEQIHVQDPHLMSLESLRARLKLPESELNSEQQKIYKQQQELQARLRMHDLIAERVNQLQEEYRRNDWQEDSRWYGLDDKKFLQDIQSRNLYHVSNYDKFRALATIDRIKTQNPDIFTKNLNELNPQQRDLREMVDGKINESTGKNEPGLQDNIRTQLVKQLRHEVTRLDIALVKQQSKQGLPSNVVDSIVGHIGRPGGWGGMFMDSDATSQAARENLERARQATQNLLALSEFKGNNLEFAQAYQSRVRELGRTLQEANENLTKMANVHHGRVEGLSDIVQVTAALTATLACSAAAPETFGGSLAAIPIVAPMAAGAAGKVFTKMIESETSVTGSAYNMPDILKDSAVAALTSAPFLPGNQLAKPLLQSAVVKQTIAAESRQLVVQGTTASIGQAEIRTGADMVMQSTFTQQMREARIYLVNQLINLTPKKASELALKYATQTGKKAAGYALAGGIDGATIQSTRALMAKEDSFKAGVQGLAGGAICGPIMMPAIKYGGIFAKKGVDWLRTKTQTTIDNSSLNAALAAEAARRANIPVKPPTEPDINKLYKSGSPGDEIGSPQPLLAVSESPLYSQAPHNSEGISHTQIEKPRLSLEDKSTDTKLADEIVGEATDVRVIPAPARQPLHMTPDPENPEGHIIAGATEGFKRDPAKSKSNASEELAKDTSQLPIGKTISTTNDSALPARFEDVPNAGQNFEPPDMNLFNQFDTFTQKVIEAERKCNYLSYCLNAIPKGPYAPLLEKVNNMGKEVYYGIRSLAAESNLDNARRKLREAAEALTPQQRQDIADVYAYRSVKAQQKVVEEWRSKELNPADPEPFFFNMCKSECWAIFEKQKELQRILVPPKTPPTPPPTPRP